MNVILYFLVLFLILDLINSIYEGYDWKVKAHLRTSRKEVFEKIKIGIVMLVINFRIVCAFVVFYLDINFLQRVSSMFRH